MNNNNDNHDLFFEALHSRSTQPWHSRSFLSFQLDVEPNDYRNVIDRMMEACVLFRVDTATTLWYAKRYLDRYLSKYQITVRQLPLIGLTSLWIANKFHDQHCFWPNDAISVWHDSAITCDDLIRQERLILETLNYEIYTVTPSTYCARVWKQLPPHLVTAAHIDATRYFLSLATRAYWFSFAHPHETAAACFVSASFLVHEECNAELVDGVICPAENTIHTEQLCRCLFAMHRDVHNAETDVLAKLYPKCVAIALETTPKQLRDYFSQ